MRYRLHANEAAIIEGPATVTLLRGHASVLCSPLDKLVISPKKQLPIEARTETEIEIFLGESGRLKEIGYRSIPKSWTAAVDSLTLMERGTAIIVGPPDAGKSTLCTFLTNELINRGMRTSVVDADIGQADIGPPTTIASARPTRPVPSLTELEPDRMVFIGHINPSAAKSVVISGIKRIMNSYDRSMTIINTDGWTLDTDAVLYKSKIISTIEPEIVIGIGSETDLKPIMDTSKSNWISVESSQATHQRTRSERREIRNSGYERYLAGSIAHNVNLEEVRIRPSIRRQICRSSDLHNLIVGLNDDKGFMLHIGVLMEIENTSLQVFAPSVRGVAEFALGSVKISTEGREMGS